MDKKKIERGCSMRYNTKTIKTQIVGNTWSKLYISPEILKFVHMSPKCDVVLSPFCAQRKNLQKIIKGRKMSRGRKKRRGRKWSVYKRRETHKKNTKTTFSQKQQSPLNSFNSILCLFHTMECIPFDQFSLKRSEQHSNSSTLFLRI